MSRNDILHLVQKNQPQEQPIPDFSSLFDVTLSSEECAAQFSKTLEAIGSTKVISIANLSAIAGELKVLFKDVGKRVITAISELSNFAEPLQSADPHQLANAEVVIIPVHLGVAENGACWVSDQLYSERVLPFITQHLVFVLKKQEIVPTMHQAYAKIKQQQYGFGTFIAGPSKTADIEQSLVIGAHGPRSLTVFLINS